MSLITLSEIISVAKEMNKAVGTFSVGNIRKIKEC